MGNMLDAIVAGLPDESDREPEACAHRPLDLIAARNEWGEPQLWCRCGHVIECPPAKLSDENGKIQTGGALRLWNQIQINETARRIAGSR